MKLMLLTFPIDPFCQPADMENFYQSRYLRGYIASLEKMGWQIDVFSDNRRNLHTEEEISRQSRIIRLPAKKGGGLLYDELFTYLPDFLAELKKWVKGKGQTYHMIQSNYWLSGWIGRQLQQDWCIPHIHTPFALGINHVGSKEVNRYTPLGRRIIEETKTLALADAVVVTCPEEREVIWRKYGLRSVDVQINPCGVDVSLFHRQGGKKAERQRGKRIILYTGGLHDGGGLLVLIGALRKLLNSRPKFARTIELWILGNPPAQTLQKNLPTERLGELAHVLAYSEFVRFLGMPQPEKTAEFYRAADICIVPSGVKGLGIAALEAMAGSCPIIAPRAAWLRHIILDGETGLLVQPDDSHVLAQTIERMLSNHGLRKRMGGRAANWVRECFDYISIGKRWDNIYREVLHEHERIEQTKNDRKMLIC